MGEIRATQLIIKKLQERMDSLVKDYEDVSKQLNYSDNAASRNRLDLQLQDIEQRIKELEQRIDKLQQGEASVDSLLQILKPYLGSVITSIQKAYQASCPQDFSQKADNLEHILEILQDIPRGNTQFTYLEHFVTYLVVDSKIPQSLSQKLQQWGQDNIRNFNNLLQNIQSDYNSSNEDAKSYLLIQVKPKTGKLDRFYISAWLICDMRYYKPETGDGFKQLSVSKPSQKTVTLHDIPEIVNKLLETVSVDVVRELTIEFFLPYKLLNHQVDSFIKVEFDTPESIGKKYRVIVRANERLQKDYPYKGLWLDKWKNMKHLCDHKTGQKFLFGNYSLDDLRKRLDKAIGLVFPKITDITSNDSNEKIFSFILMTATPIALWLRKELLNQGIDHQSAVNSLLECCILELPEKVREHRLDAPQSQDDHIGHHLSLLWEDPERLTPDAEYFYSPPQSVS